MTHVSDAHRAHSTRTRQDPVLPASLHERRMVDAGAEHALSLSPPPRLDATRTRGRRRVSGFVALLVAADLTPLIGVVLLHPAVAAPATLVAVVAVAAWRFLGLYAHRFTLSALDDLPRLLLGVCLGLGVAACLGAWVDLSGLTALAGVSALGVPAGRTVIYRREHRRRRTGRAAPRLVAILGDGPAAVGLARRFSERTDLGGEFAGFVTVGGRPEATGPRSVRPLELAVRDGRLSDVVITIADLTPQMLAHVRRTCDAYRIDLHLAPGPMSRGRAVSYVDCVWGVPVHAIRSPDADAVTRAAKRILDVVLAGTALVVSAPVVLAAAIAVWVDGGRGVIFKQERVGQGGRVFTLYKLRSLRPDSSSDADTIWSVVDDARISPVGRFLRKTSIDELPQLVNVLKGDMSLVGPRPERPRFVDRYAASVPRYSERHRVPVGMTGHAAVHGLRGDTSIPDRTVFDLDYIEHWSLWLDLKTIARTIGEVLRGRGA